MTSCRHSGHRALVPQLQHVGGTRKPARQSGAQNVILSVHYTEPGTPVSRAKRKADVATAAETEPWLKRANDNRCAATDPLQPLIRSSDDPIMLKAAAHNGPLFEP